MGNSIIITAAAATATATAIIILIRIIIITITAVITIRSTAVEISVLIILNIFFVIKGQFVKLFKLFVEIVVSKLITLVSDSAVENIGNLYFKVVGLYTLIKFIFIEESSKFIFEIELFYIFSYFKILYFTANFYSKINAVVLSI